MTSPMMWLALSCPAGRTGRSGPPLSSLLLRSLAGVRKLKLSLWLHLTIPFFPYQYVKTQILSPRHTDMVTINHHSLPIPVWEHPNTLFYPYQYGKKVMVNCNHIGMGLLSHNGSDHMAMSDRGVARTDWTSSV